MRYVELLQLGDEWRAVRVTDDLTLPPQGDPNVVRYVPAPSQAPARYALFNPATGAFTDDGWTPPTAPAPAPSTVRSRLAFRTRFTEAEQVAFETAMESHPNAQVRAALRVFDKNLSDSTEIKLDDPRTQLGLTRLVQFGLLTAERRAEILNPAWEPSA